MKRNKRNKLSLAVQYTQDADGEPPPRPRIRALVSSALPNGGDITVRFVGVAEMTSLNRRCRGKNRATNVLSFGYPTPFGDGTKNGDPKNTPLPDDGQNNRAADSLLGDIVICAPLAEREAREYRTTAADYYARLIVHGCLHLAGFVHNTVAAAQKMEASEQTILRRFGAPAFCK